MHRLLPKTIAAADRGTIALFALLLAAAAFRIFVVVNLPLWLRYELVEEDGLYLRLATSLASGHWLGPYDQLTLMKGPGYPAFLALTSLSGLPVSATHALFQTVAMAVAAWAAYRLTDSKAIAALTFLALTFDPAGFLPDAQRVIAEQITWAQVLLVFSLGALLIYVPPRERAKAIALGILLGAIFGWTWLTGEDGAWLLLGLMLLTAGALLIHRRERAERRALARNLAVAAAAFLAANALVMGANLIAYGTFAASDAKDANLKAALNALQDIDAGPVVPYVPVPAAARAAAAKVSPAFQPLSRHLGDRRLISKWSAAGCVARRQTCSDISAESLLWAFRDAAAMNGFYDSPQTAAKGYGEIAQEIRTACTDGRLKCRRRLPGGVPVLSAAEWSSLPGAIEATGRKVAFLDVANPTSVPPTLAQAKPEKFERAWALLNHPFVSTPGNKGLQTSVRGWYYDHASSQWPGFAVLDRAGAQVPFSLKRRPSADLQMRFEDDRPAWNRYIISYRCQDACTVAVSPFHRPELRLPINRERNLMRSAGSATLFVDFVNYDWNASADLDTGQKIAAWVRSLLATFYAFLGPMLLLAGLIALIAACDGAIVARTFNPVLLSAAAAWLLVLSQIVCLGLADMSPSATVKLPFAAPATYLAILATFLSFGAIVVQAPKLVSLPTASGECLRE